MKVNVKHDIIVSLTTGEWMKKLILFILLACFLACNVVFADFVSGKVKRVDLGGGKVIIARDDQDLDEPEQRPNRFKKPSVKEEFSVTVTQHTQLTGFKALRDLKSGNHVEIEAYGDESTGKPLAREITLNLEDTNSVSKQYRGF